MTKLYVLKIQKQVSQIKMRWLITFINFANVFLGK